MPLARPKAELSCQEGPYEVQREALRWASMSNISSKAPADSFSLEQDLESADTVTTASEQGLWSLALPAQGLG
jgi:hypothetical protein